MLSLPRPAQDPALAVQLRLHTQNGPLSQPADHERLCPHINVDIETHTQQLKTRAGDGDALRSASKSRRFLRRLPLFAGAAVAGSGLTLLVACDFDRVCAALQLICISAVLCNPH